MELEAWAERHDGLVPMKMAVEVLGEREARRRLKAGVWRSVRPGVVAVNGAPRTWRQEVRAVVLSCAGRAGAAHVTAVRLLGGSVDERFAGGIHVLADLATVIELPGVVLHRSGWILDGDIIRRDRMPCTSPCRTVIDISGSMSVAELGDVVDDLVRRRLLHLDDLRERYPAVRAAPGRSPARIRRVLAARLPGFDPGESPLEARIALLIGRGRIRPPEQQHRITIGGRRYRLDFAWPDRKIYLEGNGFGFHSMTSDLDRDARRQNTIVADGWTPIELTFRMTDAEILDTLARFGLTL